MEVQGTEEQIGQVILAIEKGWNIRIDKMHSRIIPTGPEERIFREEYDQEDRKSPC